MKPSMIRIGCAGWSLPGDAASRFPGQGSHLERYARVFSCVEINSSFYRPHRPETYARWAASVPEAFRFSVKMPKAITHELRLRNANADLRRFCDDIAALGEKLGCLLLQLPPSLPFERATANRFFATLRAMTSTRVVCEPRHATWFGEEAKRAMRDAAIGCVLADPSPVPGMLPLGDAATLYIRLHGSPRMYYSAYDATFIDALAGPLVAVPPGTSVWCVFDNTAAGEAIPNALYLRERVAACDAAP
ncbi:DUF72 domain-containing protein [Luteibacter sp. 329MFSha]|uniref:DUF72 domain-containing protein n=1 Tax=Luteibacter sp. 329MFSha TaxID=1798239 RepID=UPI0008C02A95|nr:DUF72 domain-containing protein [Luteibacter sp. 329MFSha]SEV91479.1 Uncharacterized conserved protein YecE, DUF72 family [Luteibacter sp. 329MFSha]